MHAVVVDVTVNDPEAAGAALKNDVVPRVAQAPGFVAGYWVGFPDRKGVSVVVFESEEAARTASEQAQPPGDYVTFDSVQVGEVVGHA
jgi:hypothetical protein